MPFFTSQSCGNAVRPYNRQKIFLPVSRRSRPWEAFDGVIGNQVDLGEESACVLREEMRLLVGIINARDQDVFKCQPLFLAGGVIIAG